MSSRKFYGLVTGTGYESKNQGGTDRCRPDDKSWSCRRGDCLDVAFRNNYTGYGTATASGLAGVLYRFRCVDPDIPLDMQIALSTVSRIVSDDYILNYRNCLKILRKSVAVMSVSSTFNESRLSTDSLITS